MDNVRALVNTKADELLEWFNPDFATFKDIPTKGWPLTDADAAVGIVVVYSLFVLFGSLFMKFVRGGKPFTFHRHIQYFYNPVQVIVCSWMCLEAIRQAYSLPNASVLGNKYVRERDSIAKVLWAFYVSKVLDFLDTVFIILSCNWRQLSFLHVYHHITIFLTYWVIINAGYDGDVYLTIVLNTFVHVCMYMYYMITSLRLADPVRKYKDADKIEVTQKGTKTVVEVKNPKFPPVVAVPYSPWWKKFITYLQMAQFLTMNAQAVYLIVTGVSVYPIRIVWFYLIYIQSLFWLFFNFAMKNYGGKKGKKD